MNLQHIHPLCLALAVVQKPLSRRCAAEVCGDRRKPRAGYFGWTAQAFREPSLRPQTDSASRLQPLSVWKSSCIIQLPWSEVQPLLFERSLAEFVFNHCNLWPLLPWLPWWVIECNGGLILGLAWLPAFLPFSSLSRAGFYFYCLLLLCCYSANFLFPFAKISVTFKAGLFWLLEQDGAPGAAGWPRKPCRLRWLGGFTWMANIQNIMDTGEHLCFISFYLFYICFLFITWSWIICVLQRKHSHSKMK